MRIFVSALFVASTIAVGIAQGTSAPQGQRPGGQQPTTQPPAPREQPAPKPQSQTSQTKMTITGCIQNAPASAATGGATGGGAAGGATGGGAASGSTSAQGRYVLANAKPATGASGGAVGTAGSTATRYQLEGQEKTVAMHLNHQVEITGTVQPASGGAAAGGAAAAPMLKVESVKMIAAKCS